MTIVIRTNCNGTLGHLVRCKHLSRALEKVGFEILFLLDKSPDTDNVWATDLTLKPVYVMAESGFITEADDSKRCLKLLAEIDVSLVIVDDYRLSSIWESELKKSGYKTMAIDDLRREHCVDLLLDTQRSEVSGEAPQSKGCVILQGSSYLLLDSALHKRRDPTHKKYFTVLLSLGGGGDLRIIHDIAASILEEYENTDYLLPFANIRIQPVIGPMASNSTLIRELQERHPLNVFPIENASSLVEHFQEADLFVGAAGMSIYEAAACDLPAVTFSIADNQSNDSADLERLGHYFHLNTLADDDARLLGSLVVTMIANYQRVVSLRGSGTYPVDGLGAFRVASVIKRYLSCGDDRFDQSSDVGEAQISCNAPDVVQHQGESFVVRACDDTDINRYLIARNLDANCNNMTRSDQIKQLEHYVWWFNTSRSSYCVNVYGQTSLYIWHEVVQSHGIDVLVGGWFVAQDKTDLPCVMRALQWQIEMTDLEFPDMPWIAVIKKTNKFVQKMNERSGFCILSEDSEHYQVARSLFPTANPDDFHHVIRNKKTKSTVLA